jgi:hypothetical protein
VLNNHLPAAVRAYRGGAIIDVNDRLSHQVDLVVYSPWSPVLRQNKKPLFLAEGVYAAIEVKSVLTTDSLVQALRASARLKRLHRIQFRQASIARSTFCTGIFAYTSRIRKPERVAEILQAFHQSGAANTTMLDFVAVNGEYCFDRFPSELTEAYAHYKRDGTKEEKSLDEVRRMLQYRCSPHAVATMLSKILEYVAPSSHLGLDLYLHSKFDDDGR